MTTREMNTEDYHLTMRTGMMDVTETIEAIANIWPYAEELANLNLVQSYIVTHKLIEKVYRSVDGLYDHILLAAPEKNCYAVIIIDRDKKAIAGHHFLNLNEKQHK